MNYKFREFISKPKLLPVFIMLFVLVINVFLDVYIGRPTATDEVQFKSAGREWAATNVFAAPEVKNFQGLNMQPPTEAVWFAHMPFYTFLFGCFVKIVGFGVLQSILFDSLIHFVFCFLTYCIYRTIHESSSPWIGLVASLLTIPLSNPGRIEELAGVFGLLAILGVFRSQHSRHKLFFAGIMLGLCAATNIIIAMFSAVQMAILLCLQPLTVRQGISRAVLCGTVALVFFVIGILPPLVTNPISIMQFFHHGGAQMFMEFRYGIENSWKYLRWLMLLIFGSLIIALLGYAFDRQKGRHRKFMQEWAWIIFGIMCILIIFPQKIYYAIFYLPWMIAVVMYDLIEKSNAVIFRVLCIAFAIVVYSVATAPYFALNIIRAQLPVEQSLKFNIRKIREKVPQGSKILASEYWAGIANDYHYFTMRHSYPEPDEIDYVLLMGYGTGKPGMPQKLIRYKDYIEQNFSVIYDNLPKEPGCIAGIQVSRSAWGYGVRILKRTTPRQAIVRRTYINVSAFEKQIAFA